MEEQVSKKAPYPGERKINVVTLWGGLYIKKSPGNKVETQPGEPYEKICLYINITSLKILIEPFVKCNCTVFKDVEEAQTKNYSNAFFPRGFIVCYVIDTIFWSPFYI